MNLHSGRIVSFHILSFTANATCQWGITTNWCWKITVLAKDFSDAKTASLETLAPLLNAAPRAGPALSHAADTVVSVVPTGGPWRLAALCPGEKTCETSDLPWVASPMIADDLKIHVFFFFKGDTRGFHKAGNSGFSRVCHWCFAMWRCLRLCWFQNYVLGMAWQMWASNHAWVGWLRGSPERRGRRGQSLTAALCSVHDCWWGKR